MASLNRKYVCLPDYECICRPRGKAVSESTMLNHRREANKKLHLTRRQPLQRGPKYSEAEAILRQYEQLASLADMGSDRNPAYTVTADGLMPQPGNEAGKDGGLEVTATGCMNEFTERSSPALTQINSRVQQTGNGSISVSIQHQENNFRSRVNHFVISDDDRDTGENELLSSEYGGSTEDESDDEGEDQFETDIADNVGYQVDDIIDDVAVDETQFSEWARTNRKWIDLYLRHGLEHAVMDDILKTAGLGYKSWKTVLSHMKKDTGLEQLLEYNAVCPGHMCFVPSPHADANSDEEMVCLECGNEDLALDSPNTVRMGYIPLLPRLRAMVRNQANCEALFAYSRNWTQSEGWMTDVFDGELFRRIRENSAIDGHEIFDVYIGISTDGFEVFQKGTCDVWPIIGMIYNLPPAMRFRMQNILPFSFVPGSKEPKNLQSFLLPLIHEIESINQDGGTAMRFSDGTIHKVRVHLMWFTGDLPAIAKVAGLVGHNGKSPCRFCLQIGYYLASSNRYYYPSQVMASADPDAEVTIDDMVILCPLQDSNARTEEHSSETLMRLEAKRGTARDELRRESGIREDSVLFRLPTMFRYSSLPIDIMHLFYNVSRRMLEEIVGGNNEFYSLSRVSLSRIDDEIKRAGEHISSQLGSRPRRLSLFKDWKAAEHKDFLLSYSLLFLDGHLPDSYLEGWAKLVSLADLCHRPELAESDIEDVQRLSIEFLEHFETMYFRFEKARVGKCKYVFHLLKHLAENLRNCGPLVNCSQLWVERYIGWVKHRLHARFLAPETLFNNAVNIEAYKMYFQEPFQDQDVGDRFLTDTDGPEIHGPHLKAVMSHDKDSLSPRFVRLLLDYLQRKYDGMSRSEAESVFASLYLIQESSRVKFICGSQVMIAGAYSRYGTLERKKARNRANWFIAAEMDITEASSDIYYGRVLNIYNLRLKEEISAAHLIRWPEWKSELKIGMFDWVTGMEVGKFGQVYKSTESERAFTAPTIEDLSIIARLISVVDHVVPPAKSTYERTGNVSGHVGLKRCSFVDGDSLKDRLLQTGQLCKDGLDRNLRRVLHRHDS